MIAYLATLAAVFIRILFLGALIVVCFMFYYWRYNRNFKKGQEETVAVREVCKAIGIVLGAILVISAIVSFFLM